MSTLLEQPTATDLTCAQLLPWTTTFLNYTDAVIADLPEDDAALDWRPTDDAGGWYFSIREQAMHIADERHDAMSWITGEDADDKLFQKEYGGTEKPWEFKQASRAEIIESLKAGRKLIDDYLGQSSATLLETTDALTKQWEETNEKLRAEGKDTAEREQRGPGRVINTVLFIVAHEQSHRCVLQAMLRQRGHAVTRYA